MSNKLKIALAQLSPLVGDVERNVSKLIEIRSKLNDDIDILVAPEYFSLNKRKNIKETCRSSRVKIKLFNY